MNTLAAASAVTFNSDRTAIGHLQGIARGRRRARPRHLRDVVRALALTAPTHRKDQP